MEKVDFQDIFLERYRRQSALKNLKIDAGGYCIHSGKISYGFRDYFLPISPPEVNYKINTLYDRPDLSTEEQFVSEQNYLLMELFVAKENPDFMPKIIAYNNFIDNIFLQEKYEKQHTLIQEIERISDLKIYTFINLCSELLTDSNLAILKKMEISEIRTNRFHIENIKNAYNRGFIISVEIDADPNPYIFEKLSELNNNIHHLIIREIRVTKNNFARIEEYYDNNRKIYKDLFYYLWDEGFTYDVFEEVINKKYTFSVLDFNSSVERLIFPYFSGGTLFNFLPNDESYFLK